VGFDNFASLFADDIYLNSLYVTVIFSFAVALISMSVSLLLAVMADRAIRSATTYKTLIIWPYAVAPVVAAVLWYFLFNPTVGAVSFFLRSVGYEWDHSLNGSQAMLLVIIASAWREISYNFLFFLAGLQAIPKSFIEAAAIDGASPARRFWTIAFPLLSPTAFFLIVMNIVYAFFDTFGVIHAITEGGPNQATNIMVYKVYSDGFLGLDLGGSAAQSVILMIVVISLTVIQFRYIERKIHY
jgi:sn-glycerol 3-phosphate transport system permease protein